MQFYNIYKIQRKMYISTERFGFKNNYYLFILYLDP